MENVRREVSFISGVEDVEHNDFMQYLTNQWDDPEIPAPLLPQTPATSKPPLPQLQLPPLPSSSLPPVSTLCQVGRRKLRSSEEVAELSMIDPGKAQR